VPYANRVFDSTSHTNDIQAAYGSGFGIITSGTTAGNVLYPITASPAGTISITNPFGACDSNGLIQINTSGTQTTGSLLTIYFSPGYAFVPTGVGVTISTTAGAAAGGTITTTITNTSLNVSIGTALTTGTTYWLRYTIAG
jgi:hypothetical protein